MVSEDDEFRARVEQAFAERNEIFRTIPGADRLIQHFGGRIPSFHDGEIRALELRTKGPCRIEIRISHPEVLSANYIFVTLTVAKVIDVELDGFNHQNVIHELWLRRATSRSGHDSPRLDVGPDDVEIEIESIWGMGGTLVGSGLSLGWSKRPRRVR